MTPDIAELIGRVERATGPDSKLDGEIFRFLNPEGHWVEFSGVWHRRDDVDFVAYDVPPKFSLSIDAALSLKPESVNAYGFELTAIGPCEGWMSRNDVATGRFYELTRREKENGE